jgi:proteasome accessory factor C
MKSISTRIKRILSLIPLLRKHPDMLVEDLAMDLGCKPREILADLNRILLCGVPPYLPDDYISVYQDGRRVSLRFADHFKRPVRLTVKEALSLKLALDSLPRGVGEELEEAKKSLKEKVSRMLGRDGRTSSSDIEERVLVDTATRKRSAKLEALEEALHKRKTVHLTYYSARTDSITERSVCPYGLVDHRGDAYLVGHCRLRGKMLPFRVDRIKEVALTDERYEIPADFDLDRFRLKTMYIPSGKEIMARIRFDGTVARWVREQYGEDRIRELSGGDIVVEIPVGGFPWIVNQLIVYGPHAEILEPAELRNYMKGHLRSFLDRFRKHSPPDPEEESERSEIGSDPLL